MAILRAGRRDFYAAGLVGAVGLIAIRNGVAVDIGTLTDMGPGFMPVVLGVLLILLGVGIAYSVSYAPSAALDATDPERPQWRAWFCILAGPLTFIALGQGAGFVPAAFACVFISALADRTTSLVSATLLAVAVTVVGGFLFLYLLNVPFPLLQWDWS
jgi:Tripartite tricarboxylate transporter TctB family